jgi:hypothetical protein
MDLDLAIWHINPAYAYRLNVEKTEILEWRHSDPQPTQAALDAAWVAVPEGFLLRALVAGSKSRETTTIKGDGLDAALVFVQWPDVIGDITIDINDSTEVLSADSVTSLGYAEAELEITSGTPGAVVEISGTGIYADQPTLTVNVD